MRMDREIPMKSRLHRVDEVIRAVSITHLPFLLVRGGGEGRG